MLESRTHTHTHIHTHNPTHTTTPFHTVAPIPLRYGILFIDAIKIHYIEIVEFYLYLVVPLYDDIG